MAAPQQIISPGLLHAMEMKSNQSHIGETPCSRPLEFGQNVLAAAIVKALNLIVHLLNWIEMAEN
jgi:hypothetical protein